MKLLKTPKGRCNSPPNKHKQITNYTNKTLNKMKTIKTLFLAILLFTMTTNAQITKGNWMVGGDGSFSNSKATNSTGIIGSSNGVGISPNIGYFFTDKLAVGIRASFNYGKTSGGPSSIGFGGSPFVRYYFLKPEKLVNVFIDANYGYTLSKTDGREETGRSYNLKAGPVVYFNSSVGLELTLNYNKSFSPDDYVYQYFYVGLGFQIHLKK